MEWKVEERKGHHRLLHCPGNCDRDTHPLEPFFSYPSQRRERNALCEHYELKPPANNNNNKSLRHMPKWLSRRRNVGETFRGTTHLNDFA